MEFSNLKTKLKDEEVAATKIRIVTDEEEFEYGAETEEEVEEIVIEEDGTEVVIQKDKEKSSNNDVKTSKQTREEPEILTSKEEAIVKEALEDNIDEKISVTEMLSKFRDYITSKDFDKKCSEAEKKTGIKQSAIKNKFIKNILGTIADILNLTITITGDIVIGAARFINSIINSVVSFTAGTLHKLINLTTLNCGSIVY